MMTPILIAVAVLGGMGFLFGAVLAYAAQVFTVQVDPRIEGSIPLLPGANCGSCGFPGCAGFATAIVEKGAPLSSCPVISPEGRKKLAEFLGLADTGTTVKKAAVVLCKGLPNEEYRKFDYQGIKDCQAAILLLNGPWLCPHRCLGQGSCVRACQFGAITMGPDDLPIIDKEKCTACGKCVAACPKQLIELTDATKHVHVICHSPEKGAEVRKACKVGCIGCGLCVKVCAWDAITIENNLARINVEKCTECGACVTKCPQKTIVFDGLPEFKGQKALIDEPNCVGCTLCFKVCKFGAIEGGKPKEKHHILPDKCVGCGACVAKCPKKCISMKPNS